MASRIDLSLFLSLMSLLSPLEKGFDGKSHHSQHTYTVQLSSLLPSSTCNPSSIVRDHNSSIEVVHKYGPCSHLNYDNLNFNDVTEQIIRQDKLRAEYIHSLLIPKKYVGSIDRRIQQELAATTTLPVKPASVLGGPGLYFVTVGLGTPKKSLSLTIDSGSDLTWTQCKPCPSQDCYLQMEAMFDPKASSSYTDEPCTTAYCSFVSSPQKPNCSSGTCAYHSGYEDKSYSEGYLAKDTLTLSPSDVNPGYLFGCGHKNLGGFRGTAGMMGLGRGISSVVEQTASKHKRFFSSCLPSTSSSSGYLIFGGSSSKAAQALYTPMIRFAPVLAQSVYGVKLLAITVAGVRLPIPDTSFSILDSGATLTILPPSLYSQLKAEFRKQMAGYPLAPSSGELDTCYYLSAAGASVTIPKISFSFDGGAVVDLPPENIMFSQQSPSRMCLAFYGYLEKINILGNTMQKGFEVVHDIGAARIGFVPGAC